MGGRGCGHSEQEREMKKRSEKDVGMCQERNLGGVEDRKQDGQMGEQEVKKDREKRGM